jgi:hypothetical protein
VWYNDDYVSHFLSTLQLPASHIIAFTDAGVGQHLGEIGGFIMVEVHENLPQVFKEEISVISFPLGIPLISSNCK